MKAFSLIEIIVSLAILSIIAASVYPAVKSFKTESDSSLTEFSDVVNSTSFQAPVVASTNTTNLSILEAQQMSN